MDLLNIIFIFEFNSRLSCLITFLCRLFKPSHVGEIIEANFSMTRPSHAVRQHSTIDNSIVIFYHREEENLNETVFKCLRAHMSADLKKPFSVGLFCAVSILNFFFYGEQNDRMSMTLKESAKRDCDCLSMLFL